MADNQVAEILRQPLQGLCLDAKLLAPMNTSIADFLAKAPEPPAFLIVRNAVHLLKVRIDYVTCDVFVFVYVLCTRACVLVANGRS